MAIYANMQRKESTIGRKLGMRPRCKSQLEQHKLTSSVSSEVGSSPMGQCELGLLIRSKADPRSKADFGDLKRGLY